MAQFQIRTLALVTLLVAMGLCWYRGHVAREQTIESVEVEIKSIENKIDAVRNPPRVFASYVTISR